MARNSSTCREDANSTDCLLRRVVDFLEEDRDKIDWDPLNFASAIILGSVAIVCTLFGLYQAFLALKKDRKVNKRGIGNWSTMTTKKWVRREMGYQFTARTPLYKIELLLRSSPEITPEVAPGTTPEVVHGTTPSVAEPQTRMWDLGPVRILFLGFSKTAPEEVSAADKDAPATSPAKRAKIKPVATWPAFFDDTGLAKLIPPPQPEKPKFKRVASWLHSIYRKSEESYSQVWNLKQFPVEYIPDDLVAAPAHAQGGVIFVAAAAAGIRSWNIDEGMGKTLIIGQKFQLEFREHQTLGIIGAFSSHFSEEDRNSPSAEKRKSPSALDLQVGMLYALGDITIQQEDSEHPKRINLIRKSNMFEEQIWELYNKVPGPTSKPTSDCFRMDSWFYRQYINTIHILFLAKTPERLPTLFPHASASLSEHPSFTTLALIGKFWSEAKINAFGRSSVHNWPGEGFFELKHATPEWGIVWSGTIDDDDSNFYLTPHSETTTETQKTKGYEIALHMCMKQLKDPSEIEQWFFEADPETQNKLRDNLFAQLQQVDTWLKHEKSAGLRTALVFRTWMLLSRAEKVLAPKDLEDANETLNSSKATHGKPTPAPQPRLNPQEEDQDTTVYDRHSGLIASLRDLLIPLELDGNTRQDMVEIKKEKDQSQAITAEFLESKGIHQRSIYAWKRIYDQHKKLRLLLGADYNTAFLALSTHDTLDRLGVILAYHEPKWKEDRKKWPETTEKVCSRFKDLAKDSGERKVEDVIIYRFLLLVLLFRTTRDNSEVLESGLWERIIPII